MKKTIIRLTTLLLPLILVLGSCATSVKSNVPLMDTEWTLEKIILPTADKGICDERGSYSLTLAADGSVFGQADCNRFSGTYTVEGNSIQFGPMVTTRAMCPSGSIADDYLKSLNTSTEFKLRRGTLTILFENGGELHFSAAKESK